MITLEYLVIGITNQFEIFFNKPFVNRNCNRIKNNLGLEISEDAVQSFELFRILSENVKFKPFVFPGLEVFDQQIKLPVESRLFAGMEFDFVVRFMRLVSKFNQVPYRNSLFKPGW